MPQNDGEILAGVARRVHNSDACWHIHRNWSSLYVYTIAGLERHSGGGSGGGAARVQHASHKFITEGVQLNTMQLTS